MTDKQFSELKHKRVQLIYNITQELGKVNLHRKVIDEMEAADGLIKMNEIYIQYAKEVGMGKEAKEVAELNIAIAEEEFRRNIYGKKVN